MTSSSPREDREVSEGERFGESKGESDGLVASEGAEEAVLRVDVLRKAAFGLRAVVDMAGRNSGRSQAGGGIVDVGKVKVKK